MAAGFQQVRRPATYFVVTIPGETAKGAVGSDDAAPASVIITASCMSSRMPAVSADSVRRSCSSLRSVRLSVAPLIAPSASCSKRTPSANQIARGSSPPARTRRHPLRG